MPSGALLCQNCHMTFSNPSLLSKHQSRFCVGGPTQAPVRDSPVRRGQTPQERWEARSTELQRIQRGEPDRYIDSPVSEASSMSIHLSEEEEEDEDSSPRRGNAEYENRLRKLRMEADSHGRNVADLQSKNRMLLQQKTEIDRRLMGGEGLDKMAPTMNSLRQQLDYAKEGRPMAGASLVGEILACRESYLRQGGNDHGILSTLAQLEAEARALAAGSNRKVEKKKSDAKAKAISARVDDLTEQLLAFELENQRLQEDLLQSQEDNNERIRRDKNQRLSEAVYGKEDEKLGKKRKQLTEMEDLLQRELAVRQKEYLAKLAELEHEIEITKQQGKLNRLRKDIHRASPPPQPPEAEMPQLMQPQYSPIDMDPLYPAPYDPSAGFMVFYDFLTGLDLGSQGLRLVTCLYNNSAQYGEPTVLPTVYSEPNPSGGALQYYAMASNNAIISARQPVPRCPAQLDLGLVIELQTTPVQPQVHPYMPPQQYPGRMSTKAWTKVQLFDAGNRLLSGRWRLPLRITPIKPHMPATEINAQPQQGMIELFIRLVNLRDADTQSLGQVAIHNAGLYSFPPQAQFITPAPHGHNIPPPPDSPPPPSPSSVQASTRRSARGQGEDYYDSQTSSQTLGFQVDRVKHSEPGEAKVKITVYRRNSGKVAECSASPVTCSTTAVRSSFKHTYHVFGQQEALFHGVEVHSDLLMIARFYLRRRAEVGGGGDGNGERLNDLYDIQVRDNRSLDEQTLVAWAAMPMILTQNDVMRVNTGTHSLQLYKGPVPDLSLIPLEPHWTAKKWTRYGRATLRLHVLQGRPRPGDITPSEDEDEDDELPQNAWLPHRREAPPTSPFLSSDGFDLYIDGCRNLPDSVTITRVTGRIMDRKYERIGREVNTSVKLDTDIYNPSYDHRVEFREPNMPPSSTVVAKVYTLDKLSKKLVVVGYGTLNIFVETGAEKQPSTDSGGVQVSLNEGAHQIRLYSDSPNGLDPLTNTLLKDSHYRYIPCATLLLRLVKAAKGPNGRTLEAEKVPQADWERLGLWQAAPLYSQRVYYSQSCTPTRGEAKLFRTLMARTRVSVREAASGLVAQEPGGGAAVHARSDTNLLSFVRSRLTKLMDSDPQNMDLTYISQYSPKDGVKFSIDGALNLPWANFTHAHFCLNPPAAFYLGQPYASYDRLSFTNMLDLKSTNKAPEWRDGFHHFPNRSYHRYLTMVIHVQEVSVGIDPQSYKYNLMEQGWTAIQVFRDGYANTSAFQLPLFQGAPSLQLLQQLAHQPAKELFEKALNNGSLHLLDSASLFVRLADARRDDELIHEVVEEDSKQVIGLYRRTHAPGDESQPVVYLDKSFLPTDLMDYSAKIEGVDLSSIVPQGKVPAEFINNLGQKFQSLVYKLYEENKMVRK